MQLKYYTVKGSINNISTFKSNLFAQFYSFNIYMSQKDEI